jgi:hypothetical protein
MYLGRETGGRETKGRETRGWKTRGREKGEEGNTQRVTT